LTSTLLSNCLDLLLKTKAETDMMRADGSLKLVQNILPENGSVELTYVQVISEMWWSRQFSEFSYFLADNLTCASKSSNVNFSKWLNLTEASRSAGDPTA
jgi:hypothetical protein